MSDVSMWSHVGTHVEVSLHFITGGRDTAEMPVEVFIGPALRLDFRRKDKNEPITLEDLRGAGEIEVGDRVILWEGRDRLYRTPASHDRPFVTEEAARWLVKDRRLRLLALTAGTRGLFGEAAFRRMKPSAYLVNCARGELVEEEALYRALVGGAWRVRRRTCSSASRRRDRRCSAWTTSSPLRTSRARRSRGWSACAA